MPGINKVFKRQVWRVQEAHLYKTARASTSEFSNFIRLAPVVQNLDNAIHRINRYPVDKCWQNKLRYPLDSDLSGG